MSRTVIALVAACLAASVVSLPPPADASTIGVQVPGLIHMAVVAAGSSTTELVMGEYLKSLDNTAANYATNAYVVNTGNVPAAPQAAYNVSYPVWCNPSVAWTQDPLGPTGVSPPSVGVAPSG